MFLSLQTSRDILALESTIIWLISLSSRLNHPLPSLFFPFRFHSPKTQTQKPHKNPPAAAMRPLIRSACCLRARVRAMATLPAAAAFSSTRTPSTSTSRPHRLILARFLPLAPPPAGARALRSSAAAAAAATVEVGGVKIAREGEFSRPTVLKAGS